MLNPIYFRAPPILRVQRALEAEQKAMERENFETKKTETEMHIMHLAKLYNQLKNQRLGLEKEHALMVERRMELSQDTMGQDTRKAQADTLRKQDLEAKFEYWAEALGEEESYSKTLTHMQARSSEEKHQRDIETAKFMQETKNYDHDMHALLVRLQDAKNERDASEHQVHDYWEEMTVYRERREARLQERKRLVHKLQLKEEALKRLMAEEEEVNRVKNARNLEAGNDALVQARAKEHFRQRIEEGFQKVMSITGIQTVEELEDGFVNRERKTSALEQLLEGNKNRINGLSDIKQELDLQLLQVKFSGSANDAERDEVEHVMNRLAEIRRAVAERQSKLNGTEGVLIKVRSGFEYLWNKLGQLELPEGYEEPAEGGEEEEGAGRGEVLSPDSTLDRADDQDGEGGEAGEEEEDASSSKGGETSKKGLDSSVVGEGKTGVIAIMRRCHKKLEAIYRYLEHNTAGVPYRECCLPLSY